MGDSSTSTFEWTFPLYVIGTNLIARPDGELLVTKQTGFAAEEVAGKGHLPIFTNHELVQRYRQVCDPNVEFIACRISKMRYLRGFLRSLPSEIHGLMLDPDPESDGFFTMMKADAIKDVEASLGENN